MFHVKQSLYININSVGIVLYDVTIEFEIGSFGSTKSRQKNQSQILL